MTTHMHVNSAYSTQLNKGLSDKPAWQYVSPATLYILLNDPNFRNEFSFFKVLNVKQFLKKGWEVKKYIELNGPQLTNTCSKQWVLIMVYFSHVSY